MYAIIEDSGQQFKVSKGDVIEVDLRDLADGQQQIEFDRVLMLGDGSEARIGAPLVEGARVIARLNGQVAGEKIHIVKFRRRANYRRKTGHRQKHLQVTIDDIVVPS